MVVRVTYLAMKWDQGLLLNDSLWYSAEAVALAEGKGFVDPFVGGPTGEHGPLTPLLLASVSWLDDPVRWQRAVLTVIGMLTLLGVVAVARQVAGWPAAIAAGWIAALYPNLWMSDALVMSESLAMLLVVVVMWFALGVVAGRPGLGRAAACGAAIGLGALARSELVLLLPILIIAVVVSGRHHAASERPGARRTIGVMAAGTAVVLLPWVGANMLRFDRPTFLTTNDGTTLFGANCDDTYYGSGTGGWSLFCVLDDVGPAGEDPAERSARQRRAAVQYAIDHPRRLPVVVVARLGRLVDVAALGNMVNGDVLEERPEWAVWAGIVSFWALAALATAGMFHVDATTRWVLLVPIVAVVITTILFYGGHRIRAPAEPAIVVAAAVAISAISGRMRQGVTR